MGNCACCNGGNIKPTPGPYPTPTPDPDPDPKHSIRIDFVVYIQTGKDKDLKIEDECGFMPPTATVGEFFCCQARFNRKQAMVDFSDTQLPVWFPFLDTNCQSVVNATKVKYDFSKCEYLSPYIKELKITINNKLDVTDDFQYIYNETKDLNAIDGFYSRGAHYQDYPVEPKDRKVIDPKTGNSLISELDLDDKKKYSPIGVIGYIKCTPDLKSVKADIKLSNDGKTYVGVGNIYKEYKCISPYIIPELDGEGYKDGGKYKVQDSFKADMEKIIDGKKSGYFIYPILIDFEYDGFVAPDDKIKSTVKLTVEPKTVEVFWPTCNDMKSCKAPSVLQNLYKDIKISDSLVCTADVINGTVIAGCVKGGEECQTGKKVPIPSNRKINIPAPDDVADGIVYRVEDYRLQKIFEYPIIPVGCTATIGRLLSFQKGDPTDYIGTIYTYSVFTASYEKGTNKDLSKIINVTDLCNKIKNDVVTLPCQTIKAKVNPEYKPKKYIGLDCSPPIVLSLQNLAINTLIEDVPIVPEQTVGMYYGLSTTSAVSTYWSTEDCEGNEISCEADGLPFVGWEAYPKSRKWKKNESYVTFCNVNFVVNPPVVSMFQQGYFFNKITNQFMGTGSSIADFAAVEFVMEYIVEETVE